MSIPHNLTNTPLTEVSMWLKVAGAVIAAASVVSRIAWIKIKDGMAEKKVDDKDSESENEGNGDKRQSVVVSDLKMRRVGEIVEPQADGDSNETTEKTEVEYKIPDIKNRHAVEEAINNWALAALPAQKKRIEDSSAAIEQERLDQQQFEQVMAEKMKRYVVEGTVQRWKMATVERSKVEEENLVERGKRLAEEVAKKWLLKTEERRVRDRRRRLEEKKIQQKKVEEVRSQYTEF
ncbi:hypothetical protein BDD12DRAFT_897266 [Trichophaea hybrida]|nr:hypothetical protein BDD12DRAFT_897266 [Trichophaea hybrida]